MMRRIVLLLAVTALMVASVATPALAQLDSFDPDINVSGPLISADDSADDNAVGNDSVDEFANDNTVQCVGDPLIDLGPDSPLLADGDEGDQCADDGGTNEDNDSTDFPSPFPFP